MAGGGKSKEPILYMFIMTTVCPPSLLFIKNPAAQIDRGLKYAFFAQNKLQSVDMVEKIHSAH